LEGNFSKKVQVNKKLKVIPGVLNLNIGHKYRTLKEVKMMKIIIKQIPKITLVCEIFLHRKSLKLIWHKSY